MQLDWDMYVSFIHLYVSWLSFGVHLQFLIIEAKVWLKLRKTQEKLHLDLEIFDVNSNQRSWEIIVGV